MSTPDYEVGTDCFLIYDYGEAGQVSILGLNTMTPPPYTTDTIEASEFRKVTSNKPGQRKIGEMAIGGNFLIGDPGQKQLRAWWKSNVINQYIRLYFNNDALTGGGNFFAADLANDANAGFFMKDYAPDAETPTNVSGFTGSLLPFGEMAYFDQHYVDVATPVMAFSGATMTGVPTTFTASAGDTLIVEGATSPANDGYHTVVSLIAGTLTVSVAFTTDEACIEDTTIHGGVV